MPLLYAITLFVSATLLFLVQPMIAKMILPLLGGTPAVWTTSMAFYQAALLAGYAYAHVTTAWLGARWQVLGHLILLVLPALVLPIGVAAGWVPPRDSDPKLWLLALLGVSVGLPFFVLSASAPLLQKWFAYTGHPSGKDPYFLYSASNLGSMLALLSYPALVEPLLPLKAGYFRLLSQSWLWTFGYGFLAMLVATCALAVWRSLRGAATPEPVGAETATAAKNFSAPAPSSSSAFTRLRWGDRSSQAIKAPERGSAPAQPDPDYSDAPALSRPGALTRLRWVALAFVPSSLMLGATAHISLDIAAIPLLWVIPLALYLLSFILVFARWPETLHKMMVLAMPLILLVLVFAMMPSGIKLLLVPAIILHLLTLFLVAMVCHGELARTRPATRHLTEFYLLMSLGGVLGGVFNALIAPLIFNSIVEYQLALVFAGLLLPHFGQETPLWLKRWSVYNLPGPLRLLVDVAWAALLGGVTLALVYFMNSEERAAVDPEGNQGILASVYGVIHQGVDWLSELAHVESFTSVQILAILTYGLPILICYSFVTRPIRFGLGVGAILLVGALSPGLREDKVLHQERSFFGVLKVKWDEKLGYHELVHGTTLHGKQSLDPSRRREALTYYHQTGPIGQVFEAFKGPDAKKHVGLIGLGSGTLASYGESGQSFTFYEIDPAVVKIAQNPEYFTYYQDCKDRGTDVSVVLGDARLRLQEAEDNTYGLIVVDAFSSDAIPIHLITREAMELYLQKLTEDGILAVHISNRYLDLQQVLANLEQDLHLAGLRQYDEDDSYPGKAKSDWVILAKQRQAFGSLAEDSRWQALEGNSAVGIWTDDYSNLLSVFDWRSYR